MNRAQAEELLRTAVGNPDARFRAGQWEAIDAIANHRRKMLVVQRTGWGKSLVYFIGTRILRERGAGPTIIVSPLLALMRNQIDAAGRLNINAESINSTNHDDWHAVQTRILDDQVDAVLISPERLANDYFREHVLQPVADRVGLLVVDEAHCISDWGHDFRPDYRRLVNILQHMPPNMPLLGTTATANDRVIDDIQTQLGDIQIQRGPLVRESLRLQTLTLPDQVSRLAWLAQTIPTLPGTGIVYVLTKRDAEQVAEWLNDHGIDARAYHADVQRPGFSSTAYREHLEELLLNNKIKALVATTALGMGYDKPDLGFVIHYQAPDSVVSYYQQVGRAGRAIDEAFGILLCGHEDANIHDYFRRSAFPDEEEVLNILALLESVDDMSIREMEGKLNLRNGQIEKVLKILSVENPAPVIKHKSRWRRTPVEYEMDHERIQRLTRQREIEWQEVQDYINADTCLMAFLRKALDDPDAAACGRCAVCRGAPVVPAHINRELAVESGRFLRHAEMVIKPKKQVAKDAFAVYQFSGNLPRDLQAEPGRVLSKWGDAGYGQWVAEDKRAGRFRSELAQAAAEMIRERWQPTPAPQWVACAPSLKRPALVADFARALAAQLGLPFVDAIAKARENEAQKMQQNRFHQCRNLDGVFEVRDNIPESPVLLVDDIVDSGWTLTVLAALLRRAGSGPVYPLALASAKAGD